MIFTGAHREVWPKYYHISLNNSRPSINQPPLLKILKIIASGYYSRKYGIFSQAVLSRKLKAAHCSETIKSMVPSI